MIIKSKRSACDDISINTLKLRDAKKTTTNYIKERLQESDIEVVDSPFHTGLVAKVNGKTGGKIICIRVGIDALPVKEESDVDFISKMRAPVIAAATIFIWPQLSFCAKILHETRNTWNGSVGFIFNLRRKPEKAQSI